ncbi:MAG: hypothetical protein Q9201_001299 [Fulgogasparrea decipioides]
MPEPPSTTPMPSLVSIPAEYGKTIPSRGRSTSPIRPAPSVERLRRAPSRTFVPLVLPIDIIDFPTIPHTRIALAIRVSAPIFMGGATAEGGVILTIDGGSRTARTRNRLPPMSIDRISVSLVGIERSGARQHMFRCLTTDLIDEPHPPPVEMARPNQPVSDQLWEVIPSSTLLPFRLDLPVMFGPPPYRSKRNTVTYLISVLVEAKVAGKRNYVRNSEEVTVLTVHDPEKALLNLPTPLVVTDEVQSSHRGSLDTVVLTAGVHRQTWISGYPLFVDVRIVNRGSKAVRKVELQLERSTFVYAHAALSDETGLSDTLRLPDKYDKETIIKAICPGWHVLGHSHDLKTCGLPIPSGLVSVDAGRFFGVRFFLNVRITISLVKHLMVQLPITIIHPNSIDIPPNSLAQVAATIEHKHRTRPPTTPDTSYKYRPGQAFLAARRQSFEDVARHTISSEEVNNIADILNGSSNPPTQQLRRHASTSQTSAPMIANPREKYRNSRFLEGTDSFRNPPSRPPPRPPITKTFVVEKTLSPQRPVIPERKAHRVSLDEGSSSRQRLMDRQAYGVQHRRTKSSLTDRGHRGPRLQRSTSGLRFSSSEEEDDGIEQRGVADPFVDSKVRLRRRVATESQASLLRGAF